MNAGVLTINGGSSSIKFALFDRGAPPVRSLSGQVERIGLAGAFLRWQHAGKPAPERETFAAADVEQAAEKLIQWLQPRIDPARLAGVGHRIVHGGPRFREAQRITPDVMTELRRISPLSPEHMPGEIALIDVFSRRFPDLPQVACFDTAFHHDMPRLAQLLPVPNAADGENGWRRYGFHGLSYTFLLAELARVAGPGAARGRLVLAHLGSGASMAAVRDGKCVDTTMSFTPAAGLVMGTRTGDLDPGVLVHILRREKLSADQLDELVNRRSGLLAVSGGSSDMRDLLEREATDPRAADAVGLFCHQARKFVAAMAASAGGLDTLVFAGGIGERSEIVRARIGDGLDFLGVRLDRDRNVAHAPLISSDDSRVAVRVIRTDEEITIARETMKVVDG